MVSSQAMPLGEQTARESHDEVRAREQPRTKRSGNRKAAECVRRRRGGSRNLRWPRGQVTGCDRVGRFLPFGELLRTGDQTDRRILST